MVDILYIENKEQLSLEYTDLIRSYIGGTERNKASGYRRWQDRQAYLLGKLLVAKLLKKHGYSPELLRNLAYSKFKRPYIKGAKFDFNISHSGEFVICAFSVDQAVGIDIEQIQSVDLEDFDDILNSYDKEIISTSGDQYVSFFRIWSAKEAILKANGCGLVNNLYKLEISGNTGIFNETVYYLKDLMIHPFYSSCIASSVPIDTMHLENISLKGLFESFK